MHERIGHAPSHLGVNGLLGNVTSLKRFTVYFPETEHGFANAKSMTRNGLCTGYESFLDA